MSTHKQSINEADGRKVKYKESIRDDIGKVDMARVNKTSKDENGVFDGDVTVI